MRGIPGLNPEASTSAGGSSVSAAPVSSLLRKWLLVRRNSLQGLARGGDKPNPAFGIKLSLPGLKFSRVDISGPIFAARGEQRPDEHRACLVPGLEFQRCLQKSSQQSWGLHVLSSHED